MICATVQLKMLRRLRENRAQHSTQLKMLDAVCADRYSAVTTLLCLQTINRWPSQQSLNVET